MIRIMKKIILFLCLICCFTGCSGTLKNYNESKKNDLNEIFCKCEYQDVERSFILCLPEKVNSKTPLVLMFHGAGSDASAFINMTLLKYSATELGYAIAYVNGIRNAEDSTSTSGWNSGIGSSSVDDVGFVKSIVKTLQKKHKIGKEKVFGVGYSNGGIFMHRLAVEASSLFTGLVCVAGFMPEAVWKKRPSRLNINFLQIYGEKDDVIPNKKNGSSKYSKNPAIEDVLNYYKKAGASNVIESIEIENGHHSWPQEEFCGFNIVTVIMDFFSKL